MKYRPRHRLLRTPVTAGPFAGVSLIKCRCGEWPPLDTGYSNAAEARAAYRLHVTEALTGKRETER